MSSDVLGKVEDLGKAVDQASLVKGKRHEGENSGHIESDTSPSVDSAVFEALDLETAKGILSGDPAYANHPDAHGLLTYCSVLESAKLRYARMIEQPRIVQKLDNTMDMMYRVLVKAQREGRDTKRIEDDMNDLQQIVTLLDPFPPPGPSVIKSRWASKV